MGLVQEKFQVEFPEPAHDNSWVSDKSVRRASGPPFSAGPGEERGGLNAMPPGTGIENQPLADTRSLPRVMDGETDVGEGWSPQAVRKGYTRFNVKPTDDSYSNEHNDPFYRTAKDGSDEGFVERNNMLDRQ